MAGQIGVRAYVTEAVAHKQIPDRRGLFPAVFQQQPAAGSQVLRGLSCDRCQAFEAAIACAIHDYPFRDAEPVRTLARNAAERLAERIGGESPDDALAETMAADLRLNGDLLRYDDPANTDIIVILWARTR